VAALFSPEERRTGNPPTASSWESFMPTFHVAGLGYSWFNTASCRKAHIGNNERPEAVGRKTVYHAGPRRAPHMRPNGAEEALPHCRGLCGHNYCPARRTSTKTIIRSAQTHARLWVGEFGHSYQWYAMAASRNVGVAADAHQWRNSPGSGRSSGALTSENCCSGSDGQVPADRQFFWKSSPRRAGGGGAEGQMFVA